MATYRFDVLYDLRQERLQQLPPGERLELLRGILVLRLPRQALEPRGRTVTGLPTLGHGLIIMKVGPFPYHHPLVMVTVQLPSGLRILLST